MIKRQEQKFFLNFDEIRDLLAKYNAFIAYPNRQINSIYYDTNNMSLYNDGEEGLVPREKYRYRWYGSMIDIKKEGNLEIKRTYSNYKDKKVIPIKFKNFEEVNKRINTLTDRFLFPVCQVSYVRSYYENYAGERFTYDFNIKYKSIISKSFISSRENILEIKFSGFDANKFSSLFGERSTRFSKYNDAVQNLFNI